jgi:hypothetical protein
MRSASGKKTYQRRKQKDPDFMQNNRERGGKYYKENRDKIREKIQDKRDSAPEEFRSSAKGMKFDIPIADMVLQAGNRCEICRVGFEESNDWNRVVDHVHRTKRVRGILCRRCNLMLGHAKDSISILDGAIAYLHRYGFMGEE